MIPCSPYITINRKTALFLFLITAITCSVSAQSAAIDSPIVLDGVHKFFPDDNSAFSSADFNDRQWSQIKIPGSWQSQGIKTQRGIGWYRIHFTTPVNFRFDHPAILLGRIGDADEVFLNGVKIGSKGLIAESFVEATKVERLYEISRDLLRYDHENVLSVRVMNTYLNGGFFDSNIMIGTYNELMLEKYKRDKYIIIVEFCFFTFFAIFFMTCFFFFLKGLRDKEYLFFWIFISLYGILFFFNSLVFYETGLKTPFIQQIINTVGVLLPANLFLLLMNVYREKINVYVKSVLYSYLFILFMFTLFPFFTLKQYFYVLWKFFFVLTAAILFFYAMKAYMRKFYESAPTLIGVTGLIIGFILESIGGLDLLQITGFFLWDYSTVFFMICVMYALASRYTRIKDLQSSSVRIFKAHEDERKRLARELHDGVGTSLLAIKLKLQILDDKRKNSVLVDGDELPVLISEISDAIDELRDVVTDLRPSFLENIELSDAFTWHAQKVQERLSIAMHVSIDHMIKVSTKMKEMLYRIYQEAVNNAIKHSGATRIDVFFKRDGNFLHLEIKDNGRGFDPGALERTRTGIGLDTIRERVELIGGILNIKSSEKSGTSLLIEVPVE